MYIGSLFILCIKEKKSDPENVGTYRKYIGGTNVQKETSKGDILIQ